MSTTALSATIAAVEEVVRPVLRAHGVELFDLSLRTEQGGWVLRVTLDAPAHKSGVTEEACTPPSGEQGTGEQGAGDSAAVVGACGVTLEQCAEVSRDLSTALDVGDIISYGYTLEVSTPGLERPLRNLQDYARFIGSRAKVTLNASKPGVGSVLRAKVSAVHEDRVTFALDDGTALDLCFEEIKRGHLLFEMPSSPKKPGSAKKVNQKTKGRAASRRRP